MSDSTLHINLSSNRDNKNRGSVRQFLAENVKQNSDLAFVSAYFTIYAYDKLKSQLDQIHHLNYLFDEQTFIKSLDPADPSE